MELGFSGLNHSFINSASALAEFNRHQEESLRAVAQANQERIEREKRMVAGADASIAQKELLEQHR